MKSKHTMEPEDDKYSFTDFAKEYQEWRLKNPQKAGRTPIYKGCPNRECFCTGACKEIVGWVDEPIDNLGLGGNAFTVKLDEKW